MTEPQDANTPANEPPYQEELEDDDDEFDSELDDEPGEPVHNECRCGDCCRALIVDVSVEDAEREPKIKERGSPIYLPAELTRTGKPELEGYSLNSKDNDYACTFLDQSTSLCSIYDSRPWVCRVFDCDGEGKEQLIQLGILPKEGRGR